MSRATASRRTESQCTFSGSAAIALLIFIAASAVFAAGQTAVTTYHNDNLRTGWNPNETTLTPANVKKGVFGLQHTVALDDQVDAQPLVVPGVMITTGQFEGTVHDVAYIASESNTVYAIDVHTGTVLLNPNFGTAVTTPLGCTNNGPKVGVNSTPVIDLPSNTLYVMIYNQDKSAQNFRLHALDLGSLTDKATPQVVSASHTLTNGTTFNFNAKYQRQRAALLAANGSVYAGFASFCDFSGNLSRGWLLGWTAGTLTPFPSNQLLDVQATNPGNFFLSSIWMSGYGLAADDSGNILFVTGNSQPNTYDGITSIQESVVKVSPTLTTVLDVFTPSNQVSLDQGDVDFGSGGALILPDQPGSTPHMAVAAGKDGNMYFMNEDNLGGYSPSKNNVLGTYGIGGCWCGQSYYLDASGSGRVVSSGGNLVKLYQVQTSPQPALNLLKSSIYIASLQDPGFFTSISSNQTSSPVIWAVSRPQTAGKYPIFLYAFDPGTTKKSMKKLIRIKAGYWPNTGGNSNLAPTVANGQVFVASNKVLNIFGLLGGNSNTKKQ
jgi:hypothetical protein